MHKHILECHILIELGCHSLLIRLKAIVCLVESMYMYSIPIERCNCLFEEHKFYVTCYATTSCHIADSMIFVEYINVTFSFDFLCFLQVAEFIVKNAGEYQSEMATTTDPFTG